MWITQRLREGFAWVIRFATQSMNIIYAEVAIVVFTLLLAPLVSLVSHAAASDVCFLGAVLLSAYAHFFDARLLLGSTGFKWLRRIGRIVASLEAAETAAKTPAEGKTGPETVGPELSEVWYWSSFVQMWAPWALVLLGFIAPWESDRYIEVLAIIFLILWAVSTQRRFGTFWRKVHMYMTALMLACALFGIYAAGWQAEVRQGWHREQELNQAKSEATNAQTADDKAYLADLHKQDSQYKLMYRRHLRDTNGRNNQFDTDWTTVNAADWAVVVGQIDELENSAEGVTATVTKSAETIPNLPMKHPGWLVIGGLILLAGMGQTSNGHTKKH